MCECMYACMQCRRRRATLDELTDELTDDEVAEEEAKMC